MTLLDLPAISRLSVVVTSRNDDHGGDPLARLQTCIDSLARQSQRYGLRIEFIVVEWNPPEDRPPLAEVLVPPGVGADFDLRVVTVPRYLHARLPNSASLPLFQMIAKNVGIRRATGDHILATNIDVILSDQVASFLTQPIDPGLLVRAYRFDVPAADVRSPIGTRLHWARVNGPSGTRSRGRFPALDVLIVGRSPMIGHALRLGLLRLRRPVLAPFGPVRRGARQLSSALVRSLIFMRAVARYALHLAVRLTLRVRHSAGRLATRRGLRRVIQAGLAVYRGGVWRALRASYRFVSTHFRVEGRWFARPRRRTIRHRSVMQGLRDWVRSAREQWRQVRRAIRAARDLPFTNACGDFTLMSREDWMRLRGYPEWPIFSWHLDSVLLLQAVRLGIEQVILPPRLGIYHLDHALGSGYSPEGAEIMFARLDRARIPYLTNTDILDLLDALGAVGDPVPEGAAGPILNLPDWGLAGLELPEWRPSALSAVSGHPLGTTPRARSES